VFFAVVERNIAVPVDDVAIVSKLTQSVSCGGADPNRNPCFPVPGYGNVIHDYSLVQTCIESFGMRPKPKGVFVVVSRNTGALGCW
jgi:hypothetical protein